MAVLIGARSGRPASLVALVALAACSAETEVGPLDRTLRVAVSTDLAIPADADAMRITVDRGGSEVFAKDYGEDVLRALPDSLLLDNDQRNDDTGDPITTPITVRVVATKEGAVVVSRSAQVVFQNDEAKLLRLPLCAACRDVVCDAGETCVRGECASERVDIDALPADGDGVRLEGECATSG